MRSAQAILIVASFVAAWVALAGCRGTKAEEPPIVPIRNMYNQPKYDPQQESPFFQDGRTMRPRVEGTVAREESPDLVVSTGRTEDNTAWALEIPTKVVAGFGDPSGPGKQALVQRGQERYDIFCAPCHDHTGAGAGMIAERAKSLGAATLAPPNLHDERIRQLPDGQLFATITNGIRNMPPYGYSISTEDRWAIVAYVRALQLSQGGRVQAMNLVEGAR